MSSSSYAAPVPRTLAEWRCGLGNAASSSSSASSAPALICPRSGSGSNSNDSVTWTSSHVFTGVLHFRALLSTLSLPAQSRVCMSLHNTAAYLISFQACTQSRLVAAPLNPKFTQKEVEYYMKDLQGACCLIEEGKDNVAVLQAAKVVGMKVYLIKCTVMEDKPVVEVKEIDPMSGTMKKISAPSTSSSSNLPTALPSDIALILHTSGTTSAPKSVPLTHANLCRTITNITSTYHLLPTDRCLVVMPLFHIHGLMAALLSTLASGGCCVLQPEGFSAHHFWRDFSQGGCTWYTAVPTIHQILLAKESSSPSASFRKNLRFVRSCSSALAPSTWKALESLYAVPVVEAYAMTEASHQMTSNELPTLISSHDGKPGKRKPGSVGRGQGVEVMIVDQEGKSVKQGERGEISVRGANVTAGYLNNPTANASSYTSLGYFRTGDEGYLDQDGFVFITGRLKELINRGGEKISPVELDSILLSHPKVAEVVCFGVEHEKYGQEVAALVVPKPEIVKGVLDSSQVQSELTQSILSYSKSHLSEFKLPKNIMYVEAIPKTATGKIQRKNVAEFYMKKRKEMEGKLKAKL